MRLYIPALVSELSASEPPNRPPLEFVEPADTSGDALEELAEQVLYEAAFASLELLFAGDGAPARVVLVASAPSKGTGSESGDSGTALGWDTIESIHADGQAGRQIIAQLLAAETQAEADRLVEQLDEEPLEWFAPEERAELAAELAEFRRD